MDQGETPPIVEAPSSGNPCFYGAQSPSWTSTSSNVKRLLAALEREGVRYAIFGAVALNLHGLARFTEDLDVFIEAEAGNIDRLKAALHSVIDDPEIDGITAEDLLGG